MEMVMLSFLNLRSYRVRIVITLVCLAITGAVVLADLHGLWDVLWIVPLWVVSVLRTSTKPAFPRMPKWAEQLTCCLLAVIAATAWIMHLYSLSITWQDGRYILLAFVLFFAALGLAFDIKLWRAGTQRLSTPEPVALDR
jgi:hypothetical protein